MADVAKVVTVIGNSPESFAKAADAAVQEAAKTLRGITGADVISMSAEVTDGKITSDRTTVNSAVALERESEQDRLRGCRAFRATLWEGLLLPHFPSAWAGRDSVSWMRSPAGAG